MSKPAHPAQAASDRVASASLRKGQAARDRVTSASPRKRDQTLWTIFRWPLLLGVLGMIGLVGALLEDGVWDWLGAALIAASVGAVAWARLRSGRR